MITDILWLIRIENGKKHTKSPFKRKNSRNFANFLFTSSLFSSFHTQMLLSPIYSLYYERWIRTVERMTAATSSADK